MIKRFAGLLAYVLLAGCAPAVSTIRLADNSSPAGGLAYVLPQGIVRIVVFDDGGGAKAIGLTVEPAQLVGDGETGTLVARLDPSPFNTEDLKLTRDKETHFLSTVSSDSVAQLLSIIEEGAKSAARLALQSARASFLSEKVVLLELFLDPLSRQGIERVNADINAAIADAMQMNAKPSYLPKATKTTVKLSVHNVDGSPSSLKPDDQVDREKAIKEALKACQAGVCARAMTDRIIRVSVGGRNVGEKLIAIPTSEVVPVPVPQTILANQKVSITMKDGILTEYQLKRDSELLGLVKVLGSIPGGLVAGFTQQRTDEKTITDKEKELTQSQSELAKSITEGRKLQSGDSSGAVPPNSAARYANETLTVYVSPRVRIGEIKAANRSASLDPPGATGRDGDLLDRKNQ
jgi:hypothetical protein